MWAIESAGVTLLKGDLMILNRARHLSEITMKKYPTESVFAFIYNALGVPVAAGLLYPVYGILPSPVIAAAAMALSLRQRHCECVASEKCQARGNNTE
ncbi:hypothetical protein [Klebsiella grimontii]|uniref:hypothetical protein n=1 Tax=Klebsiella grimontii TaxID=2058152 RepID=UPI0022346BEF|nr:hypothetical protein [Klebsiella grimontii]